MMPTLSFMRDFISISLKHGRAKSAR